MLLHNEWGLGVIDLKFGSYLPCSAGAVSVKKLAHDHIMEDMGEIPSLEKSLHGCSFALSKIMPSLAHAEADYTSYHLNDILDWDKLYQLHSFLDSPLHHMGADSIALALTHNSFGPFLCEGIFGITVTNKQIPTRYIVERHILAECRGKIPSIEQVFQGMEIEGWMCKNAKRLSEKYSEEK